MLTFNLRPIFQARGIERPYTFLVKNGLSPHSANYLLNSTTRNFRLDHVELLCRLLICEPADLLVYTPEKNHPLPENHPLSKMIKKDGDTSLTEKLANTPFSQLREISKQITDLT